MLWFLRPERGTKEIFEPVTPTALVEGANHSATEETLWMNGQGGRGLFTWVT